MSTFSHTLPSAQVKRLSLVQSNVQCNVSANSEAPVEEQRFRERPRLGAMRGLVFAVICDIILAAIAIAGWQLWRIFR